MEMQRKLTGLVLVGGLAALVALRFWPGQERSGTTQVYAQQQLESAAAQEQLIVGAEQLSAAFRNAAKAVKPAVVRINAMVKTRVRQRSARGGLPPGFPFGFPLDDSFFGEPDTGDGGGEEKLLQAGVGSGVIVSVDGYILTNNHVVQDADELDVQLSDGRQFIGKVVGTDDRSDVAVVKIDAKDLVAARLGDSSLMDVGDWVIAVGSPFELDQTVTAGIISALNRSVDILDYEDFLQTDAAINPGNSGGPLVNLRGEVIGINTAINSRTGSNAGVGFAIPSSMAKQIMDNIVTNGRVVRGFIGASLGELTAEGMRQAKLPGTYRTGVVIQKISPNDPADKAGLEPGDVIVRLDGKPLRDADAFRNRVALTPVGQSIKMTVFRDGQEMEVSVKVEEQTAAKLARLSGSIDIPEWGIAASKLTPALAQRLRVDVNDGGVVITRVEQDSKAEELKLEPGDIIMRVNNRDIATPEELLAAIKSQKQLRILLRRGNSIGTITVQ